jgi:glutathione S-transferase
MLELYHDPVSASSQKVRLVLAELDLDWADHRISLLAGEQHAPQYRAINPRGEVPALVHDGWILAESAAIDEYLVDVFGAGSLAPTDPKGRARMHHWMVRVSDAFYEACGVLSYAIAVRPIQLRQDRDSVLATIARMPDPGKRARRRAILEEGMESAHFAAALRSHVDMLRELDAELARHAWIAGPDLSLADTTALPYVLRLENLGLWPLVEPFPHVERWYGALCERPSFATAITDMIPAAIVEMTRKAGAASWPRARDILAEVTRD